MAAVQKYSIFHSTEEAVLKDWHRPYVGIFKGSKLVLDVGCGFGLFADLLRDDGIASMGLDYDPKMVEISTERGHTAILGTHDTLATMTQRFSGIHISHVVEHLWGEDVVILLERCKDLLEENGLLVIRTPNWETKEVRHKVFWMDHTHRRPYNKELLIRILTDIGFTVVSAGAEPYGLNDLYVVAAKNPPPVSSKLCPIFRRDPFRKQPLLRRILRRGKRLFSR